MIFEQPKELNEFACPSIPWTKTRLWNLTKLLIPFLVFLFLIVAESRLTRGLPVIPGLIEASLIIPFLIAMCWLASWAENRSKRTLQLKDNCIRLKPCNLWRIPWRNIRCFQIEPSGPRGEFEKFTVQFTSPGRAGRRYWSMVFAEIIQYETLLSELKNRKEAGLGKFTIEVFDTPIPPPIEFHAKSAPIWLRVFGLIFLMHGLPILMVGVTPLVYHAQNGAHRDKVNPRLAALFNHFASSQDRKRFLAITGAALTGAGTGCVALAMILERRQKNPVTG